MCLRRIIVLIGLLFYTNLFCEINSKYLLLDIALRKKPDIVDAIIKTKKVADHVFKLAEEMLKPDQKNILVGPDLEVFLTFNRERLLNPIEHYLAFLHEHQDTFDLKIMVIDGIASKDSGMNVLNNSILVKFFSCSKEEVGKYFVNAVNSIETLANATSDFSKFADHFLKLMSPDARKEYVKWHKQHHGYHDEHPKKHE